MMNAKIIDRISGAGFRPTFAIALLAMIGAGFVAGLVVLPDPLGQQRRVALATYYFQQDYVEPNALRSGWTNTTKQGTVSYDSEAELFLPVSFATSAGLEILFEFSAANTGRRRVVQVIINGKPVDSWKLSDRGRRQSRTISVPPSVWSRQSALQIVFRVSDGVVANTDKSQTARAKLGLLLHNVSLSRRT